VGALIVAPWGFPWAWERVEYEIDYEGDRVKVESKTSLAPVAALAAEKHGDVTASIIVPETILDNHSIIGGVPAPGDVARGKASYAEATTALAFAVRDYALKQLEALGVDATVRVHVAPGAGVFKNAKWLPPEGVDMFSFYAAHATLSILSDVLEAEPDTLYLDLTHGLNYTVTATYRATLYAARAYAAATAKPLTLEVYNSEPHTRGARGTLRIWRVRVEQVTPPKAASRLYYALALAGDRAPSNASSLLVFEAAPEYREKLGKRLSKPLKRLLEAFNIGNYAGSSAFNGLPLLLLQAGYEAYSASGGSPLKWLRDAASLLLALYPDVEASEEQGKVAFKHRVAYRLDPLKALIASLALAGYAHQAWREAGRPEPLKGGASVAATLDQLEKAAGWIVGPARLLAQHELSKITLACKSGRADSRDSEPYKSIAEMCRQCPQGANYCKTVECISPDYRVFVAHSGLTRGTVEACCVHGEPGLRYCEGILDGKDGVKAIARGLTAKLRETLESSP